MHRRNQWRIIVPFLAPALILYLVFVIYPDLHAFWISLHRWRGLTQMTFIGLDNFSRMAQDGIFRLALGHNVFFVLVNIVAIPVLSLTVAVALTNRLRGSGFFRTLYFFPATISVVAIAAVWKMLYNPIWGPPAVALQALGLEPVHWLGDQNLVLPSIAIVGIWSALGFHMTLYIAGIENIPQTFYEAARIDGANLWHQFRFITLPLLWQVLRISIAFIIIGGLNIFATVRVMMGGYAPDLPKSAQVLATYLYEKAFLQSDYGYGTAIAIVLFFITMIVTLASLAFTQRERLEY